MVTMKLQTTFRTTVFPLRQGFTHSVTAAATFLRCVGRGNFPDSFRSFFRFRLKCLEESSPRGIANAFGKMMIFHHAFYVQVFNGDFIEALQQIQAYLVGKVLALPLHFKMLARQQVYGFTAVHAAFLLARNRALRRFKPSFGLF